MCKVVRWLHDMLLPVRVLFINIEGNIRSEIADYSRSKETEAVFADGFEEAACMLDRGAFDRAVLYLRRFSDAAILKYINNYFSDIDVVVTTSRENEEVLEVLNQSEFSVIGYPFQLRDLKFN